MDWLQALILGIIQGLAEYLPISSSGHLEIFRQVLGIDLAGKESLAFDVTLHVATVLSTVVVLWHEFMPLCKSFFTFRRDDNFYYVLKILVSCIPVAIVGLMFKEEVEKFFEGDLMIVGICLIVTSLLLAFAYFFRTSPIAVLKGKNAGEGREIGWFDALIIGIAQAVAVLPGLSRSGSTIATGILIGNKRDKVATFSFFMVIIPILGEALLHVKDMLFPGEVEAGEQAAQAAVGVLPLVIGFIAAFIVGCLACKWMINLVKKGKLIWFAVYCLIVGIICFVA